jgi:hypothetical protein
VGAVRYALFDQRPQPLRRVQFRRVGRQRDERDPFRHPQALGPVRRGPVYDEHDALARGGVLGREGVEEELHHLGREPRQHQPEDAPRQRMDGCEDPQPLVARVVERARALTARRPDAAQDGLEPEPRFVLAPDLDRLFGVPAPERLGRRLQLFLNRACSPLRGGAGAAPGA